MSWKTLRPDLILSIVAWKKTERFDEERTKKRVFSPKPTPKKKEKKDVDNRKDPKVKEVEVQTLYTLSFSWVNLNWVGRSYIQYSWDWTDGRDVARFGRIQTKLNFRSHKSTRIVLLIPFYWGGKVFVFRGTTRKIVWERVRHNTNKWIDIEGVVHQRYSHDILFGEFESLNF